jgi:hypothetical protein
MGVDLEFHATMNRSIGSFHFRATMASRQTDAVNLPTHLVDLPWMQTLMRDEAIQTLMRDEAIQRILTSDVFAQIVRSPRFLHFCSSPEFL